MRMLLDEVGQTPLQRWLFRRLILLACLLLLSGPLSDMALALLGYEVPFWRPTSLVNLALIGVLLGLNRLGERRPLLAQSSFLIICVAATAIISQHVGGSRGPVPVLFMLAILGTGLLLHPRMIFVGAALVIVLYGGMAVAESSGLLRPTPFDADPAHGDFFTQLTFLLAFGAQAALGWLLSSSLTQALGLAQTRQEELDRHLAQLESQVAERTAELQRIASEAERRADQLALLNSTIAQIAGNLELDELLSKTVELVYQRFQFSSCSIMLLEQRPEPILVLSATIGIPGLDQDVGDYTQRLDEGIIGHVAVTGQTYLAPDVSVDPFFVTPPRAIELPGSELALPIRRGARVLGVLDVQDARRNAFAASDLSTLEVLAGQLAVAIEQARLYRGEQWARRWAEALNRTAQVLSSSLDLETVLPRLLSQLTLLLGAERAAVYLQRGEVFVQSALVDRMPAVPALATQLDPALLPLIAELCRRRAPLAIPDTEEMERFQPGAGLPRHGSWVGAPLVHEDHMVGLLVVASQRPQAFDLGTLEMVGTLAHQAAQAIVNAQLYQERAQALSDLSHAQDELLRSERMRGLGELASGVAHDFNNLLASIMGNTELLLMEEQDSERRLMLEVIMRASRDGAGTVQRLRDFARARRMETRQLIALDEIAREALGLSRPRWLNLTQRSGAPIEIALDLQPVPPVLANPAELREVLLNLILNALDAMPQGGRLTLHTYQQADQVCCTVHDSGIGIPPALHGRVFEPFFTTKGANGTGLGLSVSADLVRHHGGTLTLESAEGAGAVFSICLPLALADLPPASAMATAEPAAEPAAAASPLRVLVVDDEPAICEALSRMLQVFKHEVTTATSGEAALHLLATESFDLLFTDLGMPGVGGWEVLRGARRSDPAPLGVLMTGWGGQISEEEARAGGAAFLLMKPFDLAQVRAVTMAATRVAM